MAGRANIQSMIQIKCFVFGPFMENTYLLCDNTKECIIVDPGCYTETEKSEIKDFVTENELMVKLLVNTHCHIDHVLGNSFIKDQYKVDLVLHPKEEELLKAVKAYAPGYGFPLYQEATIDHYLEEGDHVTFGNSTFEVILVPGHSPGHIALFHQDQKICIGGDVLFQGSIGRTDLPGGDYQQLIDSIKQKLFPLGDGVKVYSGHGPVTDIGTEKISNPFVGI